MKRKTLQEQYNQIKKGKGSKEIFLKEAKKAFPNYIHNIATFNQAEKILRQKSIISENIWGVATGKTEQPDWFKIFNENINVINESKELEKIISDTKVTGTIKDLEAEVKLKAKEAGLDVTDGEIEVAIKNHPNSLAIGLTEEFTPINNKEEINIIARKVPKDSYNTLGELEDIVVSSISEEDKKKLKISDGEIRDIVEKYFDKSQGRGPGGLFEEVKAVEKKTSKEVTDLEEKNFDYKDKKDINNVYGEAFLNGYYTEMKDPKNAEKTVNEVKEIVAKNLAKDQLHYVKDGQFGERGVGYTDEHPGLKASKSDQMEKVKLKENKEYFESSNSSSRNQFINWVKKTTKKEFNDSNQDDLMDLAIRWSKEDQFEWEDPFKDEKNVRAFVQATMMDDQKTLKESRFKLRENLESHDSKKVKPKKKKVKKETIDTKLAEIDRASGMVALEAKIEALAEIIESKTLRLNTISEDEDLSELMDKTKVKNIQKEIKLLEKRKAGFEKLYEKSCGKAYQQQEIMGENEDLSEDISNDEKVEQLKIMAQKLMDDGDGEGMTQKDIDSLTHKDRVAYGRDNDITIMDYIKNKK